MTEDRGKHEGSSHDPADTRVGASHESELIRFDESHSKEHRIHVLELELRRIRQEASAARLDARAAEIELMIKRLSESASDSAETGVSKLALESSCAAQSSLSSPDATPHRFAGFQSWDEVRLAQHDSNRAAGSSLQRVSQPRIRFDGPSKPHHHLEMRSESAKAADASQLNATDASDTKDPESMVEVKAVEKAGDDSLAKQLGVVFRDKMPESVEASLIAKELELIGDEDDADRSVRKSRPMAMIVSGVLHAVVLLLLAGWTLSSQKPKDQVSISASATSAASEESMETFTLDATEPEMEPVEPTESETEYELSPIGEIAVAEFSADIAPAPPAPSVTSMMSSNASSSAAAAMSLNTFSDAKIQFCGVEGGGNHFVYLVDSSGSMGDGFDSARQELLNSIDFLKPDQRFYVIFFDAKPDLMRLANSAVDEPRSVEATPENKLALRRWATQIRQDIGKNPYDVLEFALNLKPDVIFLLSDGEFPQRIEDLLSEKNRVENLFGDSGPMCIVHTIGYYSKEGEDRMRRIAEKNGGQYRHVPKP